MYRLTPDYQAKLLVIANVYGLHKQETKTCEELGELLTEIARHLLQPEDKELRGRMLCELGDVANMLDQIVYLLGDDGREVFLNARKSGIDKTYERVMRCDIVKF